MQTVRLYSQDIGVEFVIENVNNEKKKTTYDGRNTSIQSRKDQNVRRKGNTWEYFGEKEILGNI